MFDLIMESPKDGKCYSCRRPIKKGEMIGTIDNIIFCLREDCPQKTKEQFWKGD